MKSIRYRLLLWQSAALLAVSALVSVITYNLAWDGFNRARDFGLEQVAYVLARQAPGKRASGEEAELGQYLCQIWGDDGGLRYSSRPAVLLPRQEPGMSTVSWQGEEWHVFVLPHGDTFIQVANTAADRALMFSDFTRWLWVPLGVLVGVLGSLIWIAAGEAIEPLQKLRREIGLRNPERLDRLSPDGLPDEIIPLIDALNHLMERVDQVLEQQRAMIADAAHELRTPMTAVAVQADLLGAAEDEDERRQTMASLRVSIARATHLLNQLLRLAKFQSPARERSGVDLSAVTRAAVSDFSQMADCAGIDLGLAHCDRCRIDGEEDALRVLLDNLIDNALKYCPRGSRVDVELRNEPAAVHLSVVDNGPGIPAEWRDKVFERFFRLKGTTRTGTGLGLAIVREIAVRHDASVALAERSGGGLQVSVTFPRQTG